MVRVNIRVCGAMGLRYPAPMTNRQSERIPSKRELTLFLDTGSLVVGRLRDVSLNGMFLDVGEEVAASLHEGQAGKFKLAGESWPEVKGHAPPIKFQIVRVLQEGVGLELTSNQGYFAVALSQLEFKSFFEDDEDF